MLTTQLGRTRIEKYVARPESADYGEMAAEEVSLRVASLPWELEGAFRLAYQAYLHAGLTSRLPQALRVTTHQLLDTSEVFVAVQDRKVISTVSLIDDTEYGLPMEDVFPYEVQQFRDEGLHVAEVSCLAEHPEGIGRAKMVLGKLMVLLAQHAQDRGVDKLLIAVHPRHVRYYRRMMGFEQVGEGVRDYSTVLGRPAAALSIDLRRPGAHNAEAFDRFFARRYPRQMLTRSQPRNLEFVERMWLMATGKLFPVRGLTLTETAGSAA